MSSPAAPPPAAAAAAVLLQRLDHGQDLPLPAYQTADAAGADLAAAIESELTLAPMERALIPTGFAIALPAGFEGQVRARSGLSTKLGITLINGVGTIDADYRGEIKVGLVNLSQTPWTLKRGERIAQLVIAPYTRVTFIASDELDTTSRGAAGFGSTGAGS